MKIEILYQDEDIVAVNKPSGIIVHPWKECADKVSLMKMVKETTGKWVYPVHRLDRPVSGVIFFAFSSESANNLKIALESSSSMKIYLGLCKGVLKESGIINYPLKNQARTTSKASSTAFWPITSNGFITLVKFRIMTGRYHQIRRHCSAMSHQLIGDSKYGKGRINRFYKENFGLNRLFLHCMGTKLFLPNEKQLEIAAPLPDDLNSVLRSLEFVPPDSKSLFNSPIKELKEFSKKDVV